MTEEEYSAFQNRVEESGITQQSYIINAIMGATITSSDEIEVLKKISKTFSDLLRQLRGMATNVNQMARVANGKGYLPKEEILIQTAEQIDQYRKGSEKLWQLIRSSINQQNHTEQ